MTDQDTRWYWCIEHGRVESEENRCRGLSLLGPYATRQEAEHARERVEARNEAWEAEDRRWEGERD